MVPDPTPPELPANDAERFRARQLEALGALAGRAAHDVNNVLGVVLGYVELARMLLGDADPKAVGYLDKALATVGRVRELTDALLSAARGAEREPDVAESAAEVEAACALLQRTLDPRIRLTAALERAAPCAPLRADALRQLVAGLVLDAADALPEGGRIDLRLTAATLGPADGLRPGTYLVLDVGDDGPAARRRGCLAGEGSRALETVRALAARAGGRLRVAEEVQGAPLRVELPSVLAVVPGESRPGGVPGSGLLLLVADPDLRALLEAQLPAVRHPPTIVVSAASTAREALATGDVGLVVIDDALPDADALDLAYEIAARAPAPRVLLLRGDAAAPATLPPAAVALAKPWLQDELAAALRSVTGQPPG